MKTVTYYIACDGTTFNNQLDCENHESRLFHKRLLICNIEFWDENKHNMLHPLMTDEEYDIKIDELYSKCVYINIIKDIPAEIQDYISNMWGWDIPYTKGLYKYDWNEFDWHGMEWVRET